jgi:hypothetical protein
LPSEQTDIGYKEENSTLSISPIKKKTRIEFLMNIRLDKHGIIRNTRDSPEIVNILYRTISCNECIPEWYNQNPKRHKGIASERVNIRRITPYPINQKPN